MIYLIGCDHNHDQTYDKVFKDKHEALYLRQKRFETYLLQTVQQFNFTLIAEELCDPREFAVDGQTPRRSVALDVIEKAKSLRNIDHMYCDPCTSRRYGLGIGGGLPYLDDQYNESLRDIIRDAHEAHIHDIAHRWPIREKEWIRVLGSRIERDVLFICGAFHVCTFGNRLQGMGIETTILKRMHEHSKGFVSSRAIKAEFSAYKEVLRKQIDEDPNCRCVRQFEDQSRR